MTESDPAGTAGSDLDVERRSPEATFALLSNDTRVAILRALSETPDDLVPFAQLRERVGARDSGGFNYHLGKLVGSFVRKTGEGYELTYAGRQIVGAMYAGTFTANATVGPILVDGECPLCGGDLVAEYADETATTTCTDCGEWYNEFHFPPGSLEGFTREELPRAFDRWMQHVLSGIVAGFCDVCGGRIDGRLMIAGIGDQRIDGAEDDSENRAAHVEFACRRCGSVSRTSAALPAMLHPGVEGFLYEHGVTPGSDPTWVIASAIDRAAETVVSTAPPRVEIGFSHDDDDALTVRIGPDGTVEGIEHRSSGN